MGVFFRGYSRKIGCVLLLLAIAVGYGWVRSHYRYDVISWYADGRYHVIESEAGTILRVTCDKDPSWQETGWKSLNRQDPQMNSLVHVTLQMRYVATHISSQNLSYRWIVIPLVLISFAMLLPKLTKRIPRQSITPVA